MFIEARYEKVRRGGIVRDAAILSTIGIGHDERRRMLSLSVALSEAEVHCRMFLENLQCRGICGVEYVITGDHAGFRSVPDMQLAALFLNRLARPTDCMSHPRCAHTTPHCSVQAPPTESSDGGIFRRRS